MRMWRLKTHSNKDPEPSPEGSHHRGFLKLPFHANSDDLDVEEAATANVAAVVANAASRRRSSADYAWDVLQPFSERQQLSTSNASSARRFREAVLKVQRMSGSKEQRETRHRASQAHNLRVAATKSYHPHPLDADDGEEDDRSVFESHGDAILLGAIETMPLRDDDPLQQESHSETYGTMEEATETPSSARNKRPSSWLFPCRLPHILRRALKHSWIVWIGIPALLISWILFYFLGNPEWDFLPGKVTLSWWLNFIGRQMVTLDAARLVQCIILDFGILQLPSPSRRNPWLFLGPGLRQFCRQARGWPVVATFWALLDMIFLHGDDKFVQQWFYWSGLRIYSLEAASSGSYILNSPLYLRFLIALLIAGLASSCKRFLLDFQFKQRQCLEFKARLEKILLEMILVADIAFLAEHAPAIQSMSCQSGSFDEAIASQALSKSKASLHIGFDLPKFSDPSPPTRESNIAPPSAGDLDDSNGTASTQPTTLQTRPAMASLSSSSGGHWMKDLLDPWEPPENKSDKNSVSVRDVLRFQSALAFINGDDPFGESFGPTGDRDECIKSALQLYSNLLLLNSGDTKDVLDFDVLLLAICNNEEGGDTIDPVKKKAVTRLFRPDAKHKVTQLAFVQSCDAVYKRLRYFQASVGNSSVIDNVLASIVDAMFFFVLSLLLLSLLNFNPWTLLVSMTSILVSVSFALGPSVSKYVEGVLLIAVRRPFDLGDRIYIGPPDTAMSAAAGPNVDMSSSTWFVEDINLSTTTLRFARTNEVSTVNNYAIAGSKIINCNRSPGALVVFNIILHVSIFQKDTLERFQAELNQYVVTHPRIWDSMLFCRHDAIDADLEQVAFQLSFRHRNSWQDAGRIKLHRADLVRFIYEQSVRLNVHFETPPPRRLIYHGGTLAQGQVLDYKRNLLIGDNLLSHSEKRLVVNEDAPVFFDGPPLNLQRDVSTFEPDHAAQVLPGD